MIRLADDRFCKLEESVARVEQKIDAIPRDEQLLEKIDGLSNLKKELDEVVQTVSEHDDALDAIEASLATASEAVSETVSAVERSLSQAAKAAERLHPQVRAFPRRKRSDRFIRPGVAVQVAAEAPVADGEPEA